MLVCLFLFYHHKQRKMEADAPYDAPYDVYGSYDTYPIDPIYLHHKLEQVQKDDQDHCLKRLHRPPSLDTLIDNETPPTSKVILTFDGWSKELLILYFFHTEQKEQKGSLSDD